MQKMHIKSGKENLCKGIQRLHKGALKKLQEKLAQEKRWYEKEQTTIDKKAQEFENLRKELSKLQQTYADDHAVRLRLEHQVKELERQAEQNRQVTELQREVAEGSRRLVEADAQARQEMVALQREVQAERSEVGRQRDLLEGERRDLAAPEWIVSFKGTR